MTVRALVAAAESGGSLAALEYTAPPHLRGPAPHWHETVTETFVGLDGTLTLHTDGGDVALGPGAVAVVPPGAVHRFGNGADAPARFLDLATPGADIDRYFPEVARLVAERPVWPPEDPRVVAGLAARYDTFSPPVRPA